jgi:hypothetical protein
LPVCPSFGGGACNWFNDVGVLPAFEVRDSAKIVALAIDSQAASIPIGSRHAFTGDAFVEVAPIVSVAATYDLRYLSTATGAGARIVRDALAPKRGETLGTLDTTGLAAGDYYAILELRIGANLAGAVVRPFKLVAP